MLDDQEKRESMEPAGEQPAERPAEQPAEQLVQHAAEQQAEQDPVMELPELPVSAAQAEPVMYVPEQPPKKSGSGWKLFAAAVALVAVGAGVGGATTWGLTHNLAPQMGVGADYALHQSPGMKAIAQTSAEAGASVIPAIYARVAPATVKIDVQANRGAYGGQGAGSGSGFIVDNRGYILTNNHVIDGATTIKVKLFDGTVLDGKVVSGDQFKDIALVKVDPGSKTLTTVALGDSKTVNVGELAVAIGAPFGQEWTVTAGIVSAINRTVQEASGSLPIPGAIQTDAAINPGNSGGPLLNAAGEVIGINTLIETGSTGLRGNLGIGFAVPINLAKDILPTLMAGKSVQYPFLGIKTQDLTPAQVNKLGVTEGALVVDVNPGTPAEKAGIQAPSQVGNAITADVIVAIDGKPIKLSDEVLTTIQTHKPGDIITITVMRGKEKLELKATLGVRDLNNN